MVILGIGRFDQNLSNSNSSKKKFIFNMIFSTQIWNKLNLKILQIIESN